MLFLCFILLSIALGNSIALGDLADLPMIEQKENVWETLANAAGLDTICLTHSRPKKPFSACLVGLPVSEWPIPKNIPPKVSQVISNPVDGWEVWTQFLPVAPFEPQELEILGSVTMNFCIEFGISGVTQTNNKMIDVAPNNFISRNASSWCNYTKVSNRPSHQAPAQLPQGVFFICGDRIWPAIPANATGGPCSIGKLSLLTPDLTILREKKRRGKRNIKNYDPKCDDNVYTWNNAQRIGAAIFSPQTASGVPLTQSDPTGCWLSKDARDVSLAVSDMLTDAHSVRGATLQDRAAIDYLLLTHGHGCEEFEGMCCMNLSDHSKSIHEHIKQLQEGIAKIRTVTGSWLNDLFDSFDLSPSWREFLKMAFYILVGLVILLLVLPCLVQCVRRAMNRAAREEVLVQQERGEA